MNAAAAAAFAGAFAFTMAAAQADAPQPRLTVGICGSGKRIPLPGQKPEHPAPAGCHAAACPASRPESDGDEA